jgi:hypothetical protein
MRAYINRNQYYPVGSMYNLLNAFDSRLVCHCGSPPIQQYERIAPYVIA